MARKPRRSNFKQELQMAKAIDKMQRFQEFEESILPQLREDLKKGITTEDMAKKYSKYAMARLISIAMTETDSSKAKAAAADVVDRGLGKATEKKEVSHRLEKLPEEQLNALLLTELSDSNEEETTNEASED